MRNRSLSAIGGGVVLVIVVLSLCVAGALAQEATEPIGARPATPRAGVDPRADEQLRRFGAALGKAGAFSFRVHDWSDQLLEDGQKVQLARTTTVLVRRPDAIVADTKGDASDRHFTYAGTRVHMLNRADNVYAEHTVPGEIDAMFDHMAGTYGITAPLSDLMFADPYATLIARVRQGLYLGLHDVLGIRCHHLAFRQDGLDWQIWLEDTPQALPRKVVITYKEQPGHPQYTALLDEWNLNPTIAPDAFTFTPPSGARRQDLEPLAGAGGAATTQPAVNQK